MLSTPSSRRPIGCGDVSPCRATQILSKTRKSPNEERDALPGRPPLKDTSSKLKPSPKPPRLSQQRALSARKGSLCVVAHSSHGRRPRSRRGRARRGLAHAAAAAPSHQTPSLPSPTLGFNTNLARRAADLDADSARHAGVRGLCVFGFSRRRDGLPRARNRRSAAPERNETLVGGSRPCFFRKEDGAHGRGAEIA